MRQTTFVQPPGSTDSGDARAGEAVGGLVDGAVAAERDDQVELVAPRPRGVSSVAWFGASVSTASTS